MRFVLPPLQRRALVIYVLTVVLPVGGLLALGLHAFDLQRQAVATLQAEKLSAAIDAAIEDAARQAFSVPDHPIARHRLEFLGGVLDKPRLFAPLPAAPPSELAPAYALEATDP